MSTNTCCRIDPISVCVLTGEDRLSWFANFCTADVAGLQPGAGCEAFVLNVKGRTLAHVIVLAEPDRVVLLTTGEPAVSLAEHLDRYIIRERVEIEDITPQSQLWWFGSPTLPLADFQIEVPQGTWQHRSTADGKLVRIASRISADGDSLLLQLSAEDGVGISETLAAAGVHEDASEFQRQRIAAGWPLNGLDLSDSNFPQEFRRDQQAISFTKGCYLGQETVARIDALGHVNQYLTTLQIGSDAQAFAGHELTVAGQEKPVGRITSTVEDGQGQTLALGMVRRTQIEAGQREFLCGGFAASLSV